MEKFSQLKEGFIVKTNSFGDGVIDEIKNNTIKCFFPKKEKTITFNYGDGRFFYEGEQVNIRIFEMLPIASFVKEEEEKQLSPSNENFKSSDEWQMLHPECIVLDPDGWDRKNFHYSWFTEKITFEEYKHRTALSTCSYKIHEPAK